MVRFLQARVKFNVTLRQKRKYLWFYTPVDELDTQRCEFQKKTFLIFKCIRIIFNRELGKEGLKRHTVKKCNETDVKHFGRIEPKAHRVAILAESSSNQCHVTASFDSVEASLKKELAAFP